MRSLATTFALVLLVANAGCGTRSCKDHTLLVTVTVDGAAASADSLSIAIAISGGIAMNHQIALDGRKHGSIEVTFPHGYPSRQSVAVTVAALAGGATLATIGGAITLDSSCGTLSLDFAKGRSGDGGMATMDACVAATSCSAADSCGQISDGCGGTIDCGSACVVNALYPPFGATSDVIALEGRFGASATVNFPGGATAPANVLGPTRISVVVPAASGSGLLTVTSNGSTTNATAFNHAAYAPAPQTFRGLYEQANYARQTPTLNTPRWGAGGITMPDRVWLLGGENKSEAPLTSIEEARIDGDGALRGFTTLTTTLVTARGWGTAVRTGSWVYVLGGRNAGLTAEPTIERAPIAADGTLGAFSAVSGLQMLKPRFGHQSVVIGGYVYVLGGFSGAWCAPAPQLATVERAPIGADGTLGAFEDAGVSMTVARTAFGVTVSGNYLYVVGGDTVLSDMQDVSTVEYAPIAADGTLGAFKSAGGILPFTSTGASVIVLGGKLWKMGNGIFSAPINSDGTVGNFSTVYSAPTTSFGYGTLIGDYYYMLGNGFGDCRCENCATGSFSSTERVLLGSGAIGAFASPAGNALGLTVARSNFGFAVAGNNVYAIGGNASGADVELATIGADGSLGSFAPVAGLALQTPRSGTSSAVVGNFVYVVGGLDQSSPKKQLTSVEAAAIGADNTLGPFQTQTAVLQTAGLRTLAVIGNGLCAFGGAVECAPIAADGTIGNFVVTSAPAVSGGGVDLAVLGNSLYAIDGSPPMSVATLDGNGDLSASFVTYGSYSFMVGGVGAGAVLGSSLYLLGGGSGLGPTNVVNRMPLDPVSSAPGALTSSPPLQFNHQGESALLVHGQLDVIGGTSGGMPETAPLK